ncbi:MAG: type III pantothenate kinase [Candidatus Omnitrophota bacterium]|jgi:type III pantothenate kinase
MKPKTNLLTIDIGNTSIQLGQFKGPKLFKSIRMINDHINAKTLLLKCKQFNGMQAILICSVVPKLTKLLAQAKVWRGIQPLIIQKDIRIPINNQTKQKSSVGHDRLVNAYGAYKRFDQPTICIDFGTAITFDVINANGFQGGVIAPGIQISLNALTQATAQIPLIKIKKINSVIGKTTQDSIRAGVFYGIGGLCDRIVESINKEKKTQHKIIATGGYANQIKPYTQSIKTIDHNLTLKALHTIYHKHI